MPGSGVRLAGAGAGGRGRRGWTFAAVAAAFLAWGIGLAADEAPRGWLGVSIREIGEELADQLAIKFGSTEGNGVLVAEVLKGGPAERYGLKAGDVIVEVAGRPVWEIRQLQRIVRALPVGRPVRVVVLRGAGRTAVPVTVGPMPEEAAAQLAGEAFGLLVRDLGADRRPGLDDRFSRGSRPAPEEPREGLQVILVDDPSPASRAGLRVGDLLLEIGGRAVRTLADYRRAVGEAPPDRSLAVLVQRGEQRLAFSLAPPPAAPAPSPR
jgi:serine protease Do